MNPEFNPENHFQNSLKISSISQPPPPSQNSNKSKIHYNLKVKFINSTEFLSIQFLLV